MNSFAPFEWIVAFRFLREGRTQTALIVVGVAIGVAVIVFMSALLTSLQANLIRRTLTAQAHIQLLPTEELARPLRQVVNAEILATVQRPTQRLRSIDQWQTLMAGLDEWRDIESVSPTVTGSAFLIRGDASKGVSMIGVLPERYYQIVPLPEKITSGEARLSAEDAIIGEELAKDFGLAIGDDLRLTTGQGGDVTLQVSGIVDLGNKGANSRNVYVSLRTAQSQLGLAGGATTLDLTVTDVYAAERIAQAVEAATGIKAESWIKTNGQFFQAVNAQTISNTTIRVFVALSVAMGIASVLVVSVVQKSREIGILRAMGTTRGQILRVFLTQGAVIGFLGSLAGCGLAWTAVQLWLSLTRNPDGTSLFPLAVEPSLMVVAAVIATIVGVLAAAIPAINAARLDPVVAIRG